MSGKITFKLDGEEIKSVGDMKYQYGEIKKVSSRIHKYDLDPRFVRQKVLMPKDAKVLSARFQRGFLKVWALDFGGELEERKFYVFPTGQEIHVEGSLLFVGTAELITNEIEFGTTFAKHRSLIYHVFTDAV